jgi:7,8-dihydro-6-hydroxymethylpterin-pyrophosphokinase
MHVRAFVLAPLLELSPDLCIPGRGPARALLDALDRQDCRPWREDSDRDSLSSLNGLP